jgi:hypothetical protein
MKSTISLILALICFVTVGDVAQAQEALVSPPIYVQGGPAGGTVTCRISSPGVQGPIGFTAIFANNSTNPVPLEFNSCPSAGIAQNAQCAFGAKIAGNLSFTCSLHGSGFYAGTIEIQGPAGNVLAQLPLLPERP